MKNIFKNIKELILATHNPDKVKEIKSILTCLTALPTGRQAVRSPLNIKILSLLDFDGFPEIIEDGKTIVENAIKKAEVVEEKLKSLKVKKSKGPLIFSTFEPRGTRLRVVSLYVLADDTGLEVEALGGAPGIHSARYAGEDATYKQNRTKLLNALGNRPIEQRKARFRCCMALKELEKKVKVFEGTVDGFIGFEEKGEYGFGYDSIFIVPEFQKTFAEISPEQKNKISHRAKALFKVRNYLLK